ncbi:protein phosphatase 1, regulatory subunit 3Ca [Clupea harengus]|uniref:Protein phosphatase 1 regulatory subunit 3C n=1 Tax=Clupea harengus TaxID=7950 RepID=A0A6P3VZZ7_CLUHA|nr:protein phosphatase 1, regulatory subunit 3Ca [Clupea harengus]
MNSTSIFLSTPLPGPTMPVDMAMQLYIANSPPLRSFLSSYEDCRARSLVNARCYKPLRPCLSSRPCLEAPCLGWQTPKGKAKKRVVFADSKGMSLTAVHLFSNLEDRDATSALSQLQFDLTELESATATLHVSTSQGLMLDFPQPSADYLDFRSRLLKNSVCLENCTLQERLLTGTVKVRNLAFKKSVQVRVTFDTWRSFQDVECTFMNNVYGCQDTDIFSFAIELPGYVAPKNQMEFCICYRAAEQNYWDNNHGSNYRLVPAPWKPDSKLSLASKKKETVVTPKKPIRKLGSQFDQLGCRSTCSGLFADWQSWGRIENSTPYW